MKNVIANEIIQFEHTFLFSQALKNIEESKEVEAYLLLRKLIEIKSDFVAAYPCLGWLLANFFNKMLEAEIFLEEALKKFKDPEIMFELASVYIAQNKNKQALSLLKNIIKIKNVDLSIIHYQTGIVMENSNNIQKALNSFKKAIQYSNEFTKIELIEEGIKRCMLKKEIS